ncbi:hypothetical protein PGIGA_G00129660 [Pangasianodon gigas]|uniref:Uncharacterized protein n=1 Tax=Pangasianodon gigas TaxID=30993 RepID=A0ACC5XII4_PANGG|nr:hypothetical protein [Pangasianodon gigas]
MCCSYKHAEAITHVQRERLQEVTPKNLRSSVPYLGGRAAKGNATVQSDLIPCFKPAEVVNYMVLPPPQLFLRAKSGLCACLIKHRRG